MPGVTVAIHRLAAGEVRKATEWYEKRGAGLGRALIAAVDRAIEQIADAPYRWAIFRKNLSLDPPSSVPVHFVLFRH